jgi:hypothetical protein
VRPKIVALETDKSIPHIQSRRVIIIAGVNDCLGRDILSVRQMALRAAVSDVTVDTAVDRASGVEVCHTMLVRRTGEAWALPAADKKDAEINASAIRDFLARQT